MRDKHSRNDPLSGMLCQMKHVPWRNTQPRHCVRYWFITWIWTNFMPFWTDPFLIDYDVKVCTLNH